MNLAAICIEQLDLAAKQFAVEATSYDRFALILTDNVVELLLHFRCKEEFLSDHAKWKLEHKFTFEEKATVLGHNFGAKVKFSKRIGVISSDEADFITTGHALRNELYHAGIRHDEILRGFAWYYHNLICELFGRIQFTSYGWHSNVQVSPIVETYVDDVKNAYMSIRRQLPAIADKLSKSKPPFDDRLGHVFSSYLKGRLDNLDQSLDFLVSGNPNGMTEPEMIEYIQMYDHIHGEKSPWNKELAACQVPRDLKALWAKVRQSWNPPNSIADKKSGHRNWLHDRPECGIHSKQIPGPCDSSTLSEGKLSNDRTYTPADGSNIQVPHLF